MKSFQSFKRGALHSPRLLCLDTNFGRNSNRAYATKAVMKFVKLWKVGKLGYASALRLQNALAEQHHVCRQEDVCDTILLLEHPPVYTIGIRRGDYSEEEKQRLRSTGAEFYETNRGGLITFHGPGQLVVYPIINLKNFKTSMRWYVCQIEKTVINLCNNLGLKANTSPHTGVWIGDNKVCAIGVHGSRFVTTHGLALNCDIDLNWFNHIVPCGIRDKGVTSLTKEANRKVNIDSIEPMFLESFSKNFNCSWMEFPEKEKEQLIGDIGLKR